MQKLCGKGYQQRVFTCINIIAKVGQSVRQDD
jgi:hypothetical protein